ncbi:hypothetical protein AB0H43_03130 [Hamadaea sp. NPDC050747]|uniref:hypothetical protein n=1 Tax=Hamadaea sp. NPDC050747 TaxID=3155789 RepID=UPI0033CC1EB6
MSRREYEICAGFPRGDVHFKMHLDDEEADVIRFFAERLVEEAAGEGIVDYLDVVEVNPEGLTNADVA